MNSFAKSLFPINVLLISLLLNTAFATEISKAPLDVTDKASLRRGAELFMNQCSSCHSLKYMRYGQMATDLSISPEQIKQLLQLNNAQLNDTIHARIAPDLQLKMFGTLPPDLTLEASRRNPDWIYNYLLGFYPDSARPLGFNNKVLPNTAMPNVLEGLHKEVGDQAFKAQVGDLVNFLNYAAEPHQHERKIYGIIVILFLFIFLIPVYLLHREYWKDVK